MVEVVVAALLTADRVVLVEMFLVVAFHHNRFEFKNKASIF